MPQPHQPSVHRAANAYRAAIRLAQTGEHGPFQQAFDALDAEDTDLVIVITAFIDFARAELEKLGAFKRGAGSNGIRLEFGAVEDGQIRSSTGADAVPPDHAWAGRVIAARISGDRENYFALLQALPKDPAGMGRYIGTLAMDLALTVAAAREQRHPAQAAR